VPSDPRVTSRGPGIAARAGLDDDTTAISCGTPSPPPLNPGLPLQALMAPLGRAITALE
jgi:hypothetical protein